MTTQIEAMKMMVEAITEMNDLISETSGVYGLHLNGDPSPWGEIEAGGRFERLTLKDDALAAGRAAIEAAEKVEPVILPSRDDFEAQAKYQGVKDFSLNQNGLITYANDIAEMAWRVWANKKCQPSAEIESLRKDAARYRWLKAEGKSVSVDYFKNRYRCIDVVCSLVLTDWLDSFDAAIDAAMQEKQP